MTTSMTTAKPAKTPKFLQCLYQILHAEDQRILAWSTNGSCFQIFNVQALERAVLPKYFKHGKFASFQRQLNNFGFRKWTKTRSNVCTFSHDVYTRCHPDQLVDMVAKYGALQPRLPTTMDRAKRQRDHDHDHQKAKKMCAPLMCAPLVATALSCVWTSADVAATACFAVQTAMDDDDALLLSQCDVLLSIINPSDALENDLDPEDMELLLLDWAEEATCWSDDGDDASDASQGIRSSSDGDDEDHVLSVVTPPSECGVNSPDSLWDDFNTNQELVWWP